MEVLKILISLIALGLGLWNLQRLNTLDDKNEYKDKRFLYQECLNEAKELLEKITNSLATVENLRDQYREIDSPYAGSLGGDDAHKCLIRNLTKINEIKQKVIELYKELDGVVNLGDKDSFNKCIEIRKLLKDRFIEVSPILHETENLLHRMILFANEQKT